MTFWPWQKALFCIISLDLLEKEGLSSFFFDEISLHLFGVPLPKERKNWATDIYTFLKFWLF